MVRCEKAALILLLRYLQELIRKECKGKSVECALEELEKLKIHIEEKGAYDIERELFS